MLSNAFDGWRPDKFATNHFSSGYMILLIITLELIMILKDILKGIVGNTLNNIFPSNILSKYAFVCKNSLKLSGCFWLLRALMG